MVSEAEQESAKIGMKQEKETVREGKVNGG